MKGLRELVRGLFLELWNDIIVRNYRDYVSIQEFIIWSSLLVFNLEKLLSSNFEKVLFSSFDIGDNIFFHRHNLT